MSYLPKHRLMIVAVTGGAAFLAACTAVHLATPTPVPTPFPATTEPEPPPPPTPARLATPASPVAASPAASHPRIVSNATTPLAYRRDAATHLYARNAERIYQGKLQPHLYAIGVLDVDLDRQGQITAINWRRAPKHAPEVITEIVRTVREAAPYPIPNRLGRVTYTEIWLWDKSGKFQLDTLTEGQL